MENTVFPSCAQGIHSKISRGCLTPWGVPNSIYSYVLCIFLYIHTYDKVIYKLGTVKGLTTITNSKIEQFKQYTIIKVTGMQFLSLCLSDTQSDNQHGY